MKTISILLAAAILLISCNATEHLHESGTYTIKEKDGDMTQFFEVKGTYTIVSDTLKKNDKIVINVIKAATPLKKRGKIRNDIANSY